MWSYTHWKHPPSLTRSTSVTSCLLFAQVSIPFMPSLTTRTQVKETDDSAALTVPVFILNISVKRTKFICDRGFSSGRDLVATLPINIYDSDSKVVHPSSCLHVFCQPWNSPNYLNTHSWRLSDMFGVFYRNLYVALMAKIEFWHGRIHAVPAWKQSIWRSIQHHR